MEDDKKIQNGRRQKFQNATTTMINKRSIQMEDDHRNYKWKMIKKVKMEDKKKIKMKDNQKNLISKISKCNNNDD